MLYFLLKTSLFPLPGLQGKHHPAEEGWPGFHPVCSHSDPAEEGHVPQQEIVCLAARYCAKPRDFLCSGYLTAKKPTNNQCLKLKYISLTVNEWCKVKWCLFAFFKCLNTKKYLANKWIYSLQRWFYFSLNPGKFWFHPQLVVKCFSGLKVTILNLFYGILFYFPTVLGLGFDLGAVLDIWRP